MQGKLFYDHCNTIMGMETEDFDQYKKMYIEVLYWNNMIYDDEDDMFTI